MDWFLYDWFYVMKELKALAKFTKLFLLPNREFHHINRKMFIIDTEEQRLDHRLKMRQEFL